MDEADAAQVAIEREIQDRIQAAQRGHVLVRRTGRCLNCSEPFPRDDQRVYCDLDCAEDHEKITRMRNN